MNADSYSSAFQVVPREEEEEEKRRREGGEEHFQKRKKIAFEWSLGPAGGAHCHLLDLRATFKKNMEGHKNDSNWLLSLAGYQMRYTKSNKTKGTIVHEHG